MCRWEDQRLPTADSGRSAGAGKSSAEKGESGKVLIGAVGWWNVVVIGLGEWIGPGGVGIGGISIRCIQATFLDQIHLHRSMGACARDNAS